MSGGHPHWMTSEARLVPGLLHALVEDAAREAGCSIAQILGPQQSRTIAWPRQKAMRRAFEEGFSAPQIARAFNRHHTTVLYAAGRLARKCPPNASPISNLSTS